MNARKLGESEPEDGAEFNGFSSRGGACSAALMRSSVYAAREGGCGASAVRAARGVGPLSRARVRSARTDGESLAAGREGRNGAFLRTCACFAGGPCQTKSRVAVSAIRGKRPTH